VCETPPGDPRRFLFKMHGPFMGIPGLGPLRHLLMGCDIQETEKDITVLVPLPGLTKDDFELIVGPDTMSITFKGKEPTEEKGEEPEFRAQWFMGGRYPPGRTRRIPLPIEVDPDTAKAKMDNGILRVTIEKKNPGKSVSVE
jgi:HSP20 family protein